MDANAKARIPGYEFDVFISYRGNVDHSDEESSGWVTDFVRRLKAELGALVNGNVSVYFDKDNLSSGELVDSIPRKLKALVFVPIISQRYCEEGAYAWEREFLPYKESADADPFRLVIPLLNGNMASRILPIRIHPLEEENRKRLEQGFGGPLRSVDFIWDSDGIPRSLWFDESDKTRAEYRNKLNQTVHEIKNRLLAIQHLYHVGHEGGGDDRKRPESEEEKIREMYPQTAMKTVYLGWTAPELNGKREDMMQSFGKAGIRVVPHTNCPVEDQLFEWHVKYALQAADCSVHLLGQRYDKRARYQHEAACKKLEKQAEFRQFVWFGEREMVEVEKAQEAWITLIKHDSITDRTTFSDMGLFDLVGEVRRQLGVETKKVELENDIFFVFNHLDNRSATQIQQRLTSQWTVDFLSIKPDPAGQNPNTLLVEQLPKSRLAVVYFKDALDWAIQFTKQVRKLCLDSTEGGPLHICVVGEDPPEDNISRGYGAPNVSWKVIAHERVPLEVDEVFQQKARKQGAEGGF